MQDFGDSEWNGCLLQPATKCEVPGERCERWHPSQQALGMGYLLL
jgi:hypothetical protein